MVNPKTPRSARPWMTSSGMPASLSSISREIGSMYLVQCSRNVFLKSSCSAESRKSIVASCECELEFYNLPISQRFATCGRFHLTDLEHNSGRRVTRRASDEQPIAPATQHEFLNQLDHEPHAGRP